jgi:hypothetical protein
MRVFLYEYVTGGGMLFSQNPAPPSGSLLREGAAMISALAADFLLLPETEVIALRDHRLADFRLPSGAQVYDVHSADQERGLVKTIGGDADWTIVIAPEFENILFGRVRMVERAAGRLLSPNSVFVTVAANKQLTAGTLSQHAIATPNGQLYCGGQPLPRSLCYPAMLKPLDGAGSVGIVQLEGPDVDIELPLGHEYRLEEHCDGIVASVAILGGPAGHFVLPACRQFISDDGGFRYLGGSAPLSQPLRERAERLALAAVKALPSLTGYAGIDMVLGTTEEGDVVIEVNPRLTTSYVGLRRLTQHNLAATMLDVALGREPELLFDSQPVEFSAHGTIRTGDDNAVAGDGHRRGEPQGR